MVDEQRQLDERWMDEALLMAMQADALDEVPVGAVVVLDGEIVGRGWNRPISSDWGRAGRSASTRRTASICPLRQHDCGTSTRRATSFGPCWPTGLSITWVSGTSSTVPGRHPSRPGASRC
jgi:hypothetical protein